MKKRLTALLILLLVFALAMPLAAFADIGPKPSVRVTFTGAGGREFYATLLSQASGTGPYSAEPGRSWGNDLEENEPVRQAMAAYQDPDGFYFLQHLVEPRVAECEASRRTIVELFCADIATFVRQKNAITIVEKCIDLCESDRMKLARALFSNSEVYHNMHGIFLVGFRRGVDG